MNDERFELVIDDSTRYSIGITSYEYDPSEERYKNMLYLVAYDICEPKRLRRVAKVCEDYGIRVEYSVFECDLDESTFDSLWEDLSSEINPDEDIILAYRICGSCVRKIQSMGSIVRPGKALLYII